MLKLLRAVRLVRLGRFFKMRKYAQGLRMMVLAIQNSTSILLVLIMFLFMGVVFFAASLFFFEQLDCPEKTLHFLEDADLDKYNSACTERSLFVRINCTIGSEPDQCLTPWHVQREGFYLDPHDSTEHLCCDRNREGYAPHSFNSIVQALWWGLCTLTSVGYGDQYPRTLFGRICGVAAAISGVLIVAVPLAIVARKLAEVYEQENYNERVRKDPVADRKAERRKSFQLSRAATSEEGYDGQGEAPPLLAEEEKSGLRYKKFLSKLPKSDKLKDGWGDHELPKLLARMHFEDPRMNNLCIRVQKLWGDHALHLEAQDRVGRFCYSKELLLRQAIESLGVEAAEKRLLHEAAMWTESEEFEDSESRKSFARVISGVFK